MAAPVLKKLVFPEKLVQNSKSTGIDALLKKLHVSMMHSGIRPASLNHLG
jgi:hypothetical protein